MRLKNKKVTVIGLGNSGLNAAILLRDVGADVSVTDSQDTPDIRNSAKLLKSKNIKVEIGGHTEGFIRDAELIVVSPGVENASPAVRWAEKFGIPVIGEMELGYRFCKGKIIAITGTNGKSTVTTLIGEILKNGGMDTVVCGNIGNSLCGEIGRIKLDTWVVLEVSSFQLERIEEFKPNIALILNITDDHLDRYKNFSDYFAEKLKIFCNQDANDILVLNHDAENLRNLKEKAIARCLFYSRHNKANGAYLEDEKVFCVSEGHEKKVCSRADIGIKGQHNVENVLASCLVGSLIGIKGSSIRDTLRNFHGLAHRFEAIDIIEGVEYINDSKGTTVDSTYRALDACEKPVILIAGGRDKNSDYSVIKDLVREKVKYLILIGEAKENIRKILKDDVIVYEANAMDDAVRIAHSVAKKNMIVLLSPMCSSFDMFKDYKERGELFRQAVNRLKQKNQFTPLGCKLVRSLYDAGHS